MVRQWQTFEDQVREIASHVHGRSCVPGRVAGNDIDGVIEIGPDYKVLIEITINHTLDKVRTDLTKLTNAKVAEMAQGVYAKCYIVIDREPTRAMIEGGDAAKIVVCSVSSFAALFIEYERYRVARLAAAFGSAVDPQTGEKDTIVYVPVTYKDRTSDKEYTSDQIADRLLSGKHVILLGEYGSGKSRCISEVFARVSDGWGDSFQFSFAINLRECWGMRTGEELVRRHIRGLGLDDLESAAVKVLKQRSGIYLLDGFDEMGSQSWSVDDAKLRLLRAQALEGVRDLARNSGRGCLIAGREHYFSSREEMLKALGVNEADTITLHANDEFSIAQMEDYFEAAGITVSLPDWLPRRPLICQTISQLDDDDVNRMFGLQSREAEFWNYFIGIVCKRDSRISSAFDEETILSVYVALARKSRSKPMDVGPFSLRELQDAFEAAVGQPPAEGASVMLQRLPSLGRIGAESTDRQFIDRYILDGLRGRDVALLAEIDEDRRKAALREIWMNPLSTLGQKVLAEYIKVKQAQFVSLAKRAKSERNKTLAADIVSASLRTSSAIVDFDDLEVSGANFAELDFSLADATNLRISESIIETFILPNAPPRGTTITSSIAGVVAGASSMAGLPAWSKFDSVDEFDSVKTVSKIRNAGLTVQQEILVAVIKKTFFQKGAGRKEEALLRGFGSGPAQGLAPKVLNLLLREKILTRFRGDEGDVYAPNRAHAGRMTKMLDQLRSSDDDVWTAVGNL